MSETYQQKISDEAYHTLVVRAQRNEIPYTAKPIDKFSYEITLWKDKRDVDIEDSLEVYVHEDDVDAAIRHTMGEMEMEGGL